MHSPLTTSQIMARVKSKNTKPELLVRKYLHSLGFRYRIHYAKLPGKPDIIFPCKRKIIFVNGCFWHSHEDCKLHRIPKTNQDYWEKKLSTNKQRDERNLKDLNELGWSSLVIWECETKDMITLGNKLIKWLA
jgi:DNA mismatch endonuclease (patch repair protein)